MVIIFWFSSQSGDDSQSSSDFFTNKIVKFFNISDQQTENSLKEIVSFIVRKSAHFMIYFVGGFFIYGFVNSFKLLPKNVLYYSVLLGFLYAVSDEIHQYFVPGRAAQIRDVFLDTFGVFLMVVIRWLMEIKKSDNN